MGVGVEGNTSAGTGFAALVVAVKTGLCTAFNVGVVGQDMNTTWGVLSNSGPGTRASLTLSAGMELVASAGAGVETKVLQVVGCLWASCSQG